MVKVNFIILFHPRHVILPPSLYRFVFLLLLRSAEARTEYSAVQNFLTEGQGQLSSIFFTPDVEGHALNPSQ